MDSFFTRTAIILVIFIDNNCVIPGTTTQVICPFTARQQIVARTTSDLIITGTSASLKGELPPIPTTVIGASSVCYDMMYSDEPTAFVRWGGEHGASQSLDGLGMLVEQAAESFYLWRGVQPETAPVIQLLRESA